MFLINKLDYVHVGLQAESTIKQLPAGIYRTSFNFMTEYVTFSNAAPSLGEYHTLPRQVDEAVRDEMDYFFDQDAQRGILVHGEPGNGKTRMISELALEACLKHNAVALLNPDIEQIGKIIAAVRNDDPDRRVIVIWDEFDELLDRWEHDLLRFLDGASSERGVLSIASINDLDEVPERIYKRPGRFGLVVEMPNPDYNTRLSFANKTLGLAGTAREVAEATEGLSLDYLREICHRMAHRGHTIERIFGDLALELPEAA